MPINAPYNFVPLSRFIFKPDWAGRVSHDIPFKDGLCGTLPITITAESKLIVGGEKDGGHVRFFTLPDGTDSFAIPGSSLKGMVRNVLEIASFGKMAAVRNRQSGVRDLTNAAQLFYRERVTKTIRSNGQRVIVPQAKPGWLYLDSKDGAWKVLPCEYARVEHRELSQIPASVWSSRGSAAERYDAWRDKRQKLDTQMHVEDRTPHSHRNGTILIEYAKASFPSERKAGNQSGTLVFTGNTGVRNPAKHMEFFFHSEKNEPIEVDDRVMQGFRAIHEGGKEWTYWQGRLADTGRKTRIPVFFVGSEHRVEKLGLAMMFKLAYDYSTHDLIGHTHPQHLSEDFFDLPELVFGAIRDDPDGKAVSLRGRVSFSLARLKEDQRGKTVPIDEPPAILGEPKPTYYPNYLRQPTDGRRNSGLRGSTYATAMKVEGDDVAAEVRIPEIRGWKVYPRRKNCKVPELAPEQKGNQEVQVRLHPLTANTVFEGCLRFHNLLPVELGALLWALEWGGDKNLFHGLGMAKPHGFGRVKLTVDEDKWELVPNYTEYKPGSKEGYVKAFTDCMEGAYQGAAGRDGASWRNSEQIVQLLAMADPEAEEDFPGRLEHMRLLPKQGINDFVDAKGGNRKNKHEPWVLAEYAAFDGIRDCELFPDPSPAVIAGQPPRKPTDAPAPATPWLDQALTLVSSRTSGNVDAALRGLFLASLWSGIGDGHEKARALAAIRARWEEKGWWDNPPNDQARRARGIYESG